MKQFKRLLILTIGNLDILSKNEPQTKYEKEYLNVSSIRKELSFLIMIYKYNKMTFHFIDSSVQLFSMKQLCDVDYEEL